MEAIARLGNALVGGVKTVIDLARMAVGLPPTQTGFSAALDLAAHSSTSTDGRIAREESDLSGPTHVDDDFRLHFLSPENELRREIGSGADECRDDPVAREQDDKLFREVTGTIGEARHL